MSRILEKKALVLSTPRTGSVLVSEIIHAHLLNRNKEALWLGEFLNQHLYPLYFKELDAVGTHLQYIHPRSGTYRRHPILKDGSVEWKKSYLDNTEINLELETKRRLDILKNLRVPYILKHHAITDELFKEVLSFEYDLIVVVRRRNIWEQLLSCGFAFSTNRFKYTANTCYFDIKPNNIVLNDDVFDKIVFRIKQLEKLIPIVKNNAIFLWYEDIKDMSRKAILTKIGLQGMTDITDACVKTPYKFPIEEYYNKEYLNRLREWYNREFLGFKRYEQDN